MDVTEPGAAVPTFDGHIVMKVARRRHAPHVAERLHSAQAAAAAAPRPGQQATTAGGIAGGAHSGASYGTASSPPAAALAAAGAGGAGAAGAAGGGSKGLRRPSVVLDGAAGVATAAAAATLSVDTAPLPPEANLLGFGPDSPHLTPAKTAAAGGGAGGGEADLIGAWSSLAEKAPVQRAVSAPQLAATSAVALDPFGFDAMPPLAPSPPPAQQQQQQDQQDQRQSSTGFPGMGGGMSTGMSGGLPQQQQQPQGMAGFDAFSDIQGQPVKHNLGTQRPGDQFSG